MSALLRVKNWDKFQHYRDRNPPWIKLHTALLEDYEFASLPTTARVQLMLLWLVAARTGNAIPNDAGWIAAALRIDEAELEIALLVETGWLVPAEGATAPAFLPKPAGATRYIGSEVRASVWRRDEARCVKCRSHRFIEYDHILPITWGGSGDESNVQLLCRKCNRIKRHEFSRAEQAGPDVRSEVLRKWTLFGAPQMRSLETEGEGEDMKQSTKSESSVASQPADAAQPDLSDGQLMGLVRKHLYAPDGKAPRGYSDARDVTIIRALRKTGLSGYQIADAIEGIGLMRAAGELTWLANGTKATMRVLFNTRHGVRPLFYHAQEAVYQRAKRTAPAVKQAAPEGIADVLDRAVPRKP